MTPFLRQVAAHYYRAGGISERCFIFPNRRSSLFFRHYLAAEVAADPAARPLSVPRLLTIDDFFSEVYGTPAAPKVRLLLELYRCYKALAPRPDSLDDFIFWGDVILADFNDVDRYLVDAGQLFTNIADFKGLQDSYSYLSDNQREAILRFLGHFRDARGRLTVDIGAADPTVKARFLQVWDLLHPLYRDFNRSLREQGLAYEGMVYRGVADRLAASPAADVLPAVFPGTDSYVFVGLNALNECERTVLRRLRDAGLAEFVWDWSSDLVRDPENKSSFFMRQNVAAFPQAFRPDPDGLPLPEVSVISVPSAVGQTKLVPGILAELPGGGRDTDTALVLPDENLLIPLLNAIPPEVEDINVTMGYPMKAGGLYALLSAVSALQLHLRRRGGTWYFYHRNVAAVLSSGLLRRALGEEERAAMERVRAAARYYIPAADLSAGPVLGRVFRPVVTDPASTDAAQRHALEDYLQEVIRLVAGRLRGVDDMLLELDLAKQYHGTLNLLRGLDLDVLPQTWLRVVDQLVQAISIPYRGEPLKGLQVMGPLETRALDFRHLVIIGANEGLFPRRTASASFIPPELRKGFGLPTWEYQDAVWAYYFYRMIQRAERVWMIYDSRTEGVRSGEESRYIKQLEYHFRVPVHRAVAVAPVRSTALDEDIPKLEGDVAAVRLSLLSASALQNYLYCPAKFYFYTVKGLRAEDEVVDALDAGMVGNVFHAVMQHLYDRETVTRDDLEDRLRHRRELKALVDGRIREEMRSIEVAGRNLVLSEVILEYVLKTLERDLELLRSRGRDGFRILGLERRMEMDFAGFRFIGFLDRLDSLSDDAVRIVDYKTGRVEDEDIDITDANAEEVARKLFGPSNAGRPKIALQLYLYDRFVRHDEALRGRRIFHSVYSAARLFTAPVEDVPASPRFAALAEDGLRAMLDEVVDLSVPWRRTADLGVCAWCDFKDICGR